MRVAAQTQSRYNNTPTTIYLCKANYRLRYYWSFDKHSLLKGQPPPPPHPLFSYELLRKQFAPLFFFPVSWSRRSRTIQPHQSTQESHYNLSRMLRAVSELTRLHSCSLSSTQKYGSQTRRLPLLGIRYMRMRNTSWYMSWYYQQIISTIHPAKHSHKALAHYTLLEMLGFCQCV
jgi:hypothetical protein